VLLGVGLVGAPGGALARTTDPSAADNAQGQVEQLIAKGIEARKAGDDARALELFQRAEKQEPDSARVRVHLAATYQALGEWESADRYLTLALNDSADPYVQANQGILSSARRTIDAHIGTLEISGGPPGTEIWLNGRSIGTLPIQKKLRMQSGSYTLEARLNGYYPLSRNVTLSGGALVRESLQLGREIQASPASVPVARDASAPSDTRWLTWTFAGLTAVAGGATAVAWTARERHVDNWNDDERCLKPGLTRGQVCGSEHDAGDRAETWMWVGGVATGVLAAATLVSYSLGGKGTEATESALRCGVGLGQALCSGRF
jgi:hypothetical protein